MKRIGVGGVWSFGACCLAGCLTVGPDYEAPRVTTPTRWQAAAGEASEPEALAAWWQVFDDPDLTGLVTATREQNRSLAAAVGRFDGYLAAYGIARAGFYPAVSAQAGVAWDRRSERVHVPLAFESTDNPGWLYQGGFTMTWELDLWGRVRRGREAARGEMQAALEDVRHLLVMLQAQVAAEYILLRTAQQQLAYAEQNLALQAETLEMTRERFEAGLTGELDVHQAKLNLAATTAQTPRIRARITEALNALCLLTGNLPGAHDHLLTPGPVPQAAAPPALLPAELLRRRPDIRAAERNLAAQTARIGVARADYYPLLTLNGAFAVASTYSAEVFRPAALNYNLGPSLSWSIFNAGRVRNRVRAEEAATRATLAQYEQTVLAAYRECENALAAHQREAERLEALQAAVAAADQSVTLVNELYRSGLTDFQNVLDMQRQLAAHQDALAQSQGQLAAQWVAVYKAFGGGWSPAATGSHPAPETP
ncbi:MAG: efflux transporter outer membrane subunit [Candidatus Marinimicrobia bacterium]|nr:efflux transporter outer membrane subunit [Candidatus Neomarinimicrobiota bacterium]